MRRRHGRFIAVGAVRPGWTPARPPRTPVTFVPFNRQHRDQPFVGPLLAEPAATALAEDAARPDSPGVATRSFSTGLGPGLAALALGLSLLIHGSLIYLITFGLPAWLTLFPLCVSSCLSCPAPECRDGDASFASRLGELPQCLSACLRYAPTQQQAIAVRPAEVIEVEVFEEVPRPPEPEPTPAPAPTPQTADGLYKLKGNSTAANDEGEAPEPPAASGGTELAALAPPGPAGEPARPEVDPEAFNLKKKSPPPQVVAPEVRREPAESAAAPSRRRDSETLPLHEIISRSMGRDAANRMLGSAGGDQDDPAMRRYLAAVRQQLDRNWQAAVSGPRGYRAAYEIVVEPSGRISGFRLMQSTGDVNFNRTVETAINRSSPLPPLPASYGRRPLRVAFTFSDRR